MKKLFLVLSLGLFSCSNEPKTASQKQEAINHPEEKIISANPAKDNSTDGDPAFKAPPEITSKYGPHSITRSVLQDKNGIIWLATWEGIIRFDGNLFTNITVKEGLNRFHVCSILEDKTGNLWFGTIDGGVYKYDQNYFTLYTKADGLAGNAVMCMLEDLEGNIWFGTREGVSRFSGDSFTNLTKQDGLGDNFISSIEQGRNGKIWIATNGGVSCYDPASSHVPGLKSFVNFPINKDESFHNVRVITTVSNGNIWIGCAEGLWIYDGKTIENISKNSVSYIFEDKKGNVWLNAGGTNQSNMILYKYDARSNAISGKGITLTEITVNKTPQAPFFNQIFGITEDRDGNIWFGTASGVCRYDGKSFNGYAETDL